MNTKLFMPQKVVNEQLMDLLNNLNHYEIRTKITKFFPIPIPSFFIVQLALSWLPDLAMSMGALPFESLMFPINPAAVLPASSVSPSTIIYISLALASSSPVPGLQRWTLRQTVIPSTMHSSIKQVLADNLSLA